MRFEVSRDTPKEVSEGVLGIPDIESGDMTENHGFKIGWKVFEDGRLLKQGVSDGYREEFWGPRKGRVMTVFPVTRDKTYQVETEILDDGTVLVAYHPTLAVSVDIFTLDGYAMGEGLAELAGFIAWAGGLVLIAVSTILWSLRLRRPSQRSRMQP